MADKGNHIIKWLKQQLELLFWVAALGLLFFLDSNASQPSLCIFRFLGIENCPGCGLGHAIHHALRLDFLQSVEEHLFGIPAILIIFLRIKQLLFIKKTTIYEV